MVSQAQAYGATSFASAALSGIFNLFYVTIYMDSYKLDPNWFHFSQIIFAIWNALNDPLFGYMNDRTTGLRMKAIFYGGRCWAIAFLLPWFPLWFNPSPTVIGIHFLVSISLFDTFLTYVMIVHCALLADLTPSHEERKDLNKWRQIGSIAGTVPVVGAYMLFNINNLWLFRVYCIIIAVIASFSFELTCRYVKLPRKNLKNESPIEHEKSMFSLWRYEIQGLARYTKQVLLMRNFRLFVTMNFLQYFNTYFNSNFFPVFENVIFQNSNAVALRAFVTFSALLLPPLCVLTLTEMGSKYQIIQTVNVVKFCTSLVMFLSSATSPTAMGLYLVFSNILNGAGFGFYDLVVADLIDEDFVTHKRSRPLATMMHGTQSMIAKPAQSLAPMFGVYMFGKFSTSDQLNGTTGSETILSLIVLVPLFCATIQIIVWSMYTLKGDALNQVKQQRIVGETKELI